MKTLHLLLMLAASMPLSARLSAAEPPAPEDSGLRRLEIENRFQKPEAALRYFLDRDAAGFIWSGFLESERREFTTWKNDPAHDSFYLGRQAEIRPVPEGSSRDTHVADVTYDLESIRDSAGTLAPVPQRRMTVRFILRKIQGKWKIAQPDASQFVPVLVSEKVQREFPAAR